MERTTIKHISEISGYSISTISKALNGAEDISRCTSQRIQELAKDHNYTPNNLAVSFRKQRTKTVAVVVRDLSNSVCARTVSQLQRLTFKQGLKLLVFQYFDSASLERKSLKALNSGSVDGAIIFSSKTDSDHDPHDISIPNVMVDLKKQDTSKPQNDRIVKYYIDKLIKRIDQS